MLDTKEMDEILSILEEYPDQELAVLMLREFNDKTRELGLLLLNRDSSLSHGEWKTKCDQAQEDVNQVVKRIKAL